MQCQKLEGSGGKLTVNLIEVGGGWDLHSPSQEAAHNVHQRSQLTCTVLAPDQAMGLAGSYPQQQPAGRQLHLAHKVAGTAWPEA